MLPFHPKERGSNLAGNTSIYGVIRMLVMGLYDLDDLENYTMDMLDEVYPTVRRVILWRIVR